MYISCFGPASKPGQPPKLVNISVRIANATLATFTLFREPGGVVEPRTASSPADPSDHCLWALAPPANPQNYNLQIVAANVGGVTCNAEISITLGNDVLNAFDGHDNPLTQPIKMSSIPSGGGAMADIWINLP